MNIETGQEIPLVQHPADDYLLGLSMDDQWLIFASDRTGNLSLWIANVSGTKIQGEPILIKPGIERILPIGLTRKGALYYGVVRATEDIFAVDLDPTAGKVTSPPGKMIESYEGGNFTPSFSPDGKYIIFAAPDTSHWSVSNLWRIPVEGGKPEKMRLQRSWGIIHITVSPDGRQIAFAGRGGASTDSELWVLENFLPEEK